MKRQLPFSHANDLLHVEGGRFGVFFNSIRSLPPIEKVEVVRAAFYMNNNDIKLGHSLGMELKKLGRIDEAKTLLSFLPKVEINIPEYKIGLILGKRGRTIKQLSEKYGVRIDIENDGKITIYSADLDAANRLVEEIQKLMRKYDDPS